jgi:hypothetical protein
MAINHNQSVQNAQVRIMTSPCSSVSEHDLLESQLLIWLRDIVQSHDALMQTLRGLLSSYTLLLAADHGPDARGQLLKIEGVLQNAELLRGVSRSSKPTRDIA